MKATIVSADELKKELSGYTPEHAEEFHTESARKADKKFDAALKCSEHPTVILMSGGPASGKTEFVSEYLLDKDVLVFDGILPTENGAKIKIDHIRKSKKVIKIYAVWPEDMKAAYVAFLNRDRKFSDKHFYEKHSAARRILLWIATTYSDIAITIFKSAYLEGKLHFTELVGRRDDMVAYIRENQYHQDDIMKIVSQ